MERAEQPFANLLEAGLALVLCVSPEVRLSHNPSNALVKVMDYKFLFRKGPRYPG